MKTEYELRVLEIDKEEIAKKILELGGRLEGEFEQKRYVYDFIPKIHDKWIRLRTNGKKATLTIKEITKDTIDGTRELEIEVSNFEDTNRILNELGYKSKAYQENRRTRYSLNSVEVDIDEWPLIPAFLEIEGSNEQEINEILALLEIDKSKVTAKDVLSIYEEDYEIDLHSIEELKFS